MKSYRVYFEIYEKRLKTTVKAKNQEHAKQIIKDKIIFHKIDSDEDDLFLREDDVPPDDDLDYLKKMLGIKD